MTPTLPSHWSRRQTLKNTFIYGCIRIAFATISLLPLRLMRPVAELLGLIAYATDRQHRKRAIAQLTTHLGVSVPKAKSLTARMFKHLAHSALETTHLTQLAHQTKQDALTAEHRQLLDEALAENKGVIAVTGHLGNWELLAQVLATAGYPIYTIAKPLYDPRITRWVHQQRSRADLGVIWRGQNQTAREIIRVFRRKQILAVLIDQDTQVQGTFVPFFGQPAYTPTAAATLALRFGCPVILGWSHRVSQGPKQYTHHIHLERMPIPKTMSHDDPAAVQELTARFNKRLEQGIQQHPEQWVWLHKRWRKAVSSAATLLALAATLGAPSLTTAAKPKDVAAQAQTKPKPKPSKPSQSQSYFATQGDGQLDFRCDSMTVHSEPNRVVCNDHVVVRRDALLLCCETFEGNADADWTWNNFVCKRRVRAKRGGETMWSHQADFDMPTQELVLTGEPRLKRGKSLMRGTRIILEADAERAKVVKPRGKILPTDSELGPAPKPISGKLPNRCPLPPAPGDKAWAQPS